jgi:hypothetical protein
MSIRVLRDPRLRPLWLALAMLLLLKLWFAWHLRVNTDEPQHLHVVWAWTQGLLPYRDVFDNHAPLFQWLSAPLFAWIGERGDVLHWMRLAVIPWYGFGLWCTYRIGRALFSPVIGIWGMLLAAVYPDFFVLSVQYRTDDAWAPLWLATILVAIEGQPTPRRAAMVGWFAGAAATVSLKSLPLLATLALAAIAVLVLQRMARHAMPWAELGRTAGAALAGFALLPALIGAFFWFAGAWREMVYCVFVHNVVPGLGAHPEWRWFLFPLSVPPLLGIGYLLLRGSPFAELGAKRAFVFLAAMFYLTALLSYWPLVTRQDRLPFVPFAAIYLAAALYTWRPTEGLWPARLLALFTAELLMLLAYYQPWKDHTRSHIRMVSDILRLTDHGQFVMDAKGENLYRPRPFYYVLEGITLARMRLGLIDDDIPQRLVATGTAVVVADRLPAVDRRFVARHYLPITPQIQVAGLRLPAATPGEPIEFELTIPGRYVVLEDGMAARGTLDGLVYTGPRELAAGRHRWVPAAACAHPILVWAQAVERGFLPHLDLTAHAEQASP